MLKNLDKYDILLASNSPRRRELLGGLGIRFSVASLPDVDESYPSALQGGDIPAYISRKKASSYRSLMKENTLLITADTIVWLNGKVYGKPKDKAEAKSMLHDLSGKVHTVFTGVTICTKETERTFTVASEVTFAVLDDEEIDYYVETFQPLDKAGSYGVQEWIGYVGVKSINGSYFNVMGLPVHRLYKELKQL